MVALEVFAVFRFVVFVAASSGAEGSELAAMGAAGWRARGREGFASGSEAGLG